jgi:hypothetical protein
MYALAVLQDDAGICVSPRKWWCKSRRAVSPRPEENMYGNTALQGASSAVPFRIRNGTSPATRSEYEATLRPSGAGALILVLLLSLGLWALIWAALSLLTK